MPNTVTPAEQLIYYIFRRSEAQSGMERGSDTSASRPHLGSCQWVEVELTSARPRS